MSAISRKQGILVVGCGVVMAGVLYTIYGGLALERQAKADKLSALLADPDAAVRASAAGGIGTLGDPDRIHAVRAVVADSDPRVRLMAGWSLWKLGDPDAGRPPLVEALRSRDPQMRRDAVTAVRRLEDTRTADILAIVLTDPDPGVRMDGALGLVRINQQAGFDALRRALGDRRPDHRVAAAAALSRVDDPRAVQLASTAVAGDDPIAAAMAALALHRWSHADASVPVLRRTLEQGRDDLRISVCEGLGLLGGPQAEALLRKTLSGAQQPAVAKAAKAALDRVLRRERS